MNVIYEGININVIFVKFLINNTSKRFLREVLVPGHGELRWNNALRITQQIADRDNTEFRIPSLQLSIGLCLICVE